MVVLIWHHVYYSIKHIGYETSICRNPPIKFYRRQKNLDLSSTDQHLRIYCSYENITNNFFIIYNKPTRCNSGSIVFINNYKYALHVSDAICVHLQEHYKHNIARVASCWFIIYYRLVMHGNSNIKKQFFVHTRFWQKLCCNANSK